MAVNDNLLLYIEPKNPPSKKPVIDIITCTMVDAFRRAKSGVANYMNDEGPYEFMEGVGYKGTHTCSCNVRSSNRDYLLPHGEMTNSLAVHYLAYHRDEISEEQLERVDTLSDDASLPTDEELRVPKGSEGFDIDDASRQLTVKPEPLPESRYGDKRWLVGWRDRGLGHGDFGVIDDKQNIIADIPLNENDREHTYLIVQACNHHNELVGMVQEALDMINADCITNVVEKVENLNKRLSEIKNYNKELIK